MPKSSTPVQVSTSHAHSRLHVAHDFYHAQVKACCSLLASLVKSMCIKGHAADCAHVSALFQQRVLRIRTAQHSTAQHGTARHSTALHGTSSSLLTVLLCTCSQDAPVLSVSDILLPECSHINKPDMLQMSPVIIICILYVCCLMSLRNEHASKWEARVVLQHCRSRS